MNEPMDPQDRKPRIVELRVAFDGPMEITGMSAPGTEPFQLFGKDGKPVLAQSVELGMGFQRPHKGPTNIKVLNRAAADITEMWRDPTRALQRFRTLLAVDTGTRTLSGARVSVAASIALVEFTITGGRWSAKIVDQDPYEFHNANISPERIGWVDLMQRAVTTALPTPVGIIVDSELGELPDYNRRTTPIVPGFPMPVGYELVFASADAGTSEYLGNAAIQYCDRRAKAFLDRIERDEGARRAPFEARDSLCEKRRHWVRKP
jgi:hypothetical protein